MLSVIIIIAYFTFDFVLHQSQEQLLEVHNLTRFLNGPGLELPQRYL